MVRENVALDQKKIALKEMLDIRLPTCDVFPFHLTARDTRDKMYRAVRIGFTCDESARMCSTTTENN